MDGNSFYIEFLFNDEQQLAEITPYKKEGDILYFDVSIQNHYQFSLTAVPTSEKPEWKIVLKNSDNEIDPDLAQIIGEQIDLHYQL